MFVKKNAPKLMALRFQVIGYCEILDDCFEVTHIFRRVKPQFFFELAIFAEVVFKEETL